jgi:hypothetical protein
MLHENIVWFKRSPEWCTLYSRGPQQQRAINIQEGDVLYIEENPGTDPSVHYYLYFI